MEASNQYKVKQEIEQIISVKIGLLQIGLKTKLEVINPEKIQAKKLEIDKIKYTISNFNSKLSTQTTVGTFPSQNFCVGHILQVELDNYDQLLRVKTEIYSGDKIWTDSSVINPREYLTPVQLKILAKNDDYYYKTGFDTSLSRTSTVKTQANR